MGETKKQEAARKKRNKILAIIAGGLFVVLMIVSGMGSGWISGFVAVKPGDTVVIDYTLYDAAGQPFLTTDQTAAQQAVAAGKNLLYTRQLTVIANQSSTTNLTAIQVYSPADGWTKSFAIFNSEYNAISSGVVGMRANEEKQISLAGAGSMSQTWSAEQLIHNNVNISEINVGDMLTMGVSDVPAELATNSSAGYLRLGEVTQKTSDGIVVDFGIPTADIRVYSINAQS
jgi:hypothetical protein